MAKMYVGTPNGVELLGCDDFKSIQGDYNTSDNTVITDENIKGKQYVIVSISSNFTGIVFANKRTVLKFYTTPTIISNTPLNLGVAYKSVSAMYNSDEGSVTISGVAESGTATIYYK